MDSEAATRQGPPVLAPRRQSPCSGPNQPSKAGPLEQIGPRRTAAVHPWGLHRPCRPGRQAPAGQGTGHRRLASLPGLPGRISEQSQPIPGYQIVRELGQGGMGVVSLALRAADGTVVALKTIKPAADAGRSVVERFLREAAILRELDHPHIVTFRDWATAGRLFFAMDFVPGIDAARLLLQQGPWPIPRAVGLVCQLLQALDYAHGRRLVHRDIKPANVLVAKVQGREEARLVDFGLARLYQASKLSGLTLEGRWPGTAPPGARADHQLPRVQTAGGPVRRRRHAVQPADRAVRP